MDNIFDQAAKFEYKKKSKKSKIPPSSEKIPAKTTPSTPIASKIPAAPPGFAADSTLNDMLKSMTGMKEDIDEKLTYLYEQSKRLKIDLNQVLNKSAHLFSNDYAKMKEIYGKVLKMTGEEEKQKVKIKTQEEKLTQDRKDKFRGIRKKWINMQ